MGNTCSRASYWAQVYNFERETLGDFHEFATFMELREFANKTCMDPNKDVFFTFGVAGQSVGENDGTLWRTLVAECSKRVNNTTGEDESDAESETESDLFTGVEPQTCQVEVT